MSDLPAEPTVELRHRAWLVLGLLLVWFVVFDLLVDPMYRWTNSTYAEWVIAVLLGAMFAQPALLAIWTVFGPGPGLMRIPLAIGAFANVMLANFMVCWLKHRNSMASPTHSERLLFALGAIYIVFVVVTLASTSLTKLRVHRVDESWLSQATVNQYSVRYLLGLTAAIAVLLAICRGVVKSMAGAEITLSPSGFLSLATDSGVVLLLIAAAIAPPLLVLTPRMNVLSVAVCVLNWILLTFVSLRILGIVYPSPPSNLTERVLLMQIGAALMTLASVIVLRVAGYRLIRRPSDLPEK